MRTDSHIGSILLTTAFQNLSQQAAPVACMLARMFGAKIHVLHVPESGSEPIPMPEGIGAVAIAEPFDRTIATAHARLGGFVRRFIAPFHQDVIEAVVYAIPVYEAICGYARAHRIDLIVMGTHGDTMLHRLFFGSISKAVLEHAPCPVLLVPCPKVGQSAEGQAAAVEEGRQAREGI